MVNNGIDKFINFDATGLHLATFSDIRSALIERYKAVYGSDIDLSTGTADGVFVNDLSLIINNILQSIQTLYANLNINTATGIYLDALCNLSNVTRKPATKSNTSIIVKNIGTTDIVNKADVLFVDKSGKEWKYDGLLSLAVGESKSIQVFCTEYGAIEAPAGWIYQTVELTTISVMQNMDADVGRVAETDAELRGRLTQANSAGGLTTLESLASALLNVDGIKDVAIYNNNNNTEKIINDMTNVAPHSVYVAIRREDGIIVDDKVIADIIHEKLTPGIRTNKYNDADNDTVGVTGTAKEYQYVEQVQGFTIAESEQNVYWKDASYSSIQSRFKIIVTPLDYFSQTTLDTLAKNVMKVVNNFPMNGNKDRTSLYLAIDDAIHNSDPKYNNQRTYALEERQFVDNSSWLRLSVSGFTPFYYDEYAITQTTYEEQPAWQIIISNKNVEIPS